MREVHTQQKATTLPSPQPRTSSRALLLRRRSRTAAAQQPFSPHAHEPAGQLHEPPDLHAHPAGALVLTHCTHCSLDFCSVPPQVHVEPHLQVPPQVSQSENGHALAIASLTCSIVMEPQPQPAPHSHCFPVAAQEQSAHLSQKKLIAGGVAMLAAMVTGWVPKGAGEKRVRALA